MEKNKGMTAGHLVMMAGLISGIVMVVFFSIIYAIMKLRTITPRVKLTLQRGLPAKNFKPGYQGILSRTI